MTRPRGLAAVALGIPLAVSLGCATAALTPARSAAASDDTEEMKARIVSLQEKVTVAEVEIDRLRRRLASLEALLAETRAMVADGAVRVEPLPGPLAEVDTVESSDLEPRPRREISVPPPAPAPPTEPDPAAPASTSAEAQALYDEGYTLFHQGRYVDAESAFQRFLQSHAASELADNALYWVGEARYARGDLRGALSAFGEAVERYPAGNKVADALLKSGDCLAGLGDSEQARERYAEVESRFPRTAAAAIAAERRAALP